MRGRYNLNGNMIPRSVRRSIDQREEPRTEVTRQAAQIIFRGQPHVVRVINVSSSGAMLVFAPVPHIGEAVVLQLAGEEQIAGRICWVRDGHIGIQFAAARG